MFHPNNENPVDGDRPLSVQFPELWEAIRVSRIAILADRQRQRVEQGIPEGFVCFETVDGERPLFPEFPELWEAIRVSRLAVLEDRRRLAVMRRRVVALGDFPGLTTRGAGDRSDMAIEDFPVVIQKDGDSNDMAT